MEAKRTGIRRRILFVVKSLYTMERLGVMYLSSLARAQGWETDLAISDDSAYGDLLERIRRSRPDILGFSVMSPEYAALEDLARRLRRDTGCFLLFGGPHPTFSPEMASQPFVDAILIGEGDISFPAFLERFAEGGDYTQVEGMHFHVDGTVIRNPPAPLVEDLDRLYAFLYAAWVGFTMRFRLEGNRKSRTEVLFFLKSLLGSSLLRRR